MKVTCLSNVSDNLKSLVSQKLGLSPNKFIDKQTLVDLTELYCTENNIDTVDYENYIDDIADFIANRLNVNMDQDALGANLETGLLVSEDDYDAFYEQNQMLLNTEIEATPENLSMALSATEIHSFVKIVNLENGNIYVSFPEATFGEVYVSPNKQDNIFTERDKTPIADTKDLDLQSLKSRRLRISQILDKSIDRNELYRILASRGKYESIIQLIDSTKTSLKDRISDIQVDFDDVNEQKNKPLFNSYRGRRAYYDATNKTIHININASYVDGDASSVIMHEIMHAVTLDLLKSNPDQASKLRDIMNEYSDKVNSTRYDIEHGLEEFVADIWSNPQVIEQLKNTKSDNSNKSLWDKIKDFFSNLFSRELFGNIEDDSLMAKATQELYSLLDMNISERQLGYYFENENQTEFTESSVLTNNEQKKMQIGLI